MISGTLNNFKESLHYLFLTKWQWFGLEFVPNVMIKKISAIYFLYLSYILIFYLYSINICI